MGWLAGLWQDVLGTVIDGPEADFSHSAGGSLSAAQLVVSLRSRYPRMTVAHLYDHPRLGSLAGFLGEVEPESAGVAVPPRIVAPMPSAAPCRAGSARPCHWPH